MPSRLLSICLHLCMYLHHVWIISIVSGFTALIISTHAHIMCSFHWRRIELLRILRNSLVCHSASHLNKGESASPGSSVSFKLDSSHQIGTELWNYWVRLFREDEHFRDDTFRFVSIIIALISAHPNGGMYRSYWVGATSSSLRFEHDWFRIIHKNASLQCRIYLVFIHWTIKSDIICVFRFSFSPCWAHVRPAVRNDSDCLSILLSVAR